MAVSRNQCRGRKCISNNEKDIIRTIIHVMQNPSSRFLLGFLHRCYGRNIVSMYLPMLHIEAFVMKPVPSLLVFFLERG